MNGREYEGRTDLRKAGLKRLHDAEVLLDAGEPHEQGAAYLAGYAVECKLKWIAMEMLGCWTLRQLARKWKVDERDVYTHGLEYWASRLSLYGRLRNSDHWRVFVTEVNKWHPSWRCSPNRVPKDARKFVQAVKSVLEWLEANRA